MSVNKLLVGLALGAGVIGGVVYFNKLSRTSANLEVIPSAMIHKLNLTAMHIKMDVRLKNPDAGSFKLKFPFIKLVYDGNTIGTSQAVDKDIELPAHGEAVINGIIIQIPLLGILSTTFKIYQSLIKGTEIKLTATTITTIDLGWKRLPFEKNDEIVLKKSSQRESAVHLLVF